MRPACDSVHLGSDGLYCNGRRGSEPAIHASSMFFSDGGIINRPFRARLNTFAGISKFLSTLGYPSCRLGAIVRQTFDLQLKNSPVVSCLGLPGVSGFAIELGRLREVFRHAQPMLVEIA